MDKFIGRQPDDEEFEWSETQIQIYIAQELRKRGIVHASGMEGVNKSKISGHMAKLMGGAAGEPDLRIYLPNGHIEFIELKLPKPKGKLSKAQLERIPLLQSLGFSVNVVYAKTPLDGWAQTIDIITPHLTYDPYLNSSNSIPTLE